MIYKLIGERSQADFIAGAIRDKMISAGGGCSIIREADGADRKVQVEKVIRGATYDSAPLDKLPFKDNATLILIGEVEDEVEAACPGLLAHLVDGSCTITLEV